MENKKWTELVNVMKKTFKLSGKQVKGLETSTAARFVAGIPYYAGCRNSDRKAISNLALIIMSQKGAEAFAMPNTEDDADILERLELFTCFSDGDKDVLKKAAAQLTLLMIEDYKDDREIDKKSGKYNPLNTGAIDYDKEKEKLDKIVASVSKKTGGETVYYASGAWWSMW